MLAQRPRRIQFLRAGLGALAVALWAPTVGCSNAQDDFTAGLSADPCNGNVPACNDVVGCILTGSSYTQGTFPGSGKFLIQTTGPSTVEVAFYVVDPTAAGTATTITWYESGCTSSFQQQVAGTVFVGEAENNQGSFSRSQALSAPGDHLITFSSDATATFFVKVVITPTT